MMQIGSTCSLWYKYGQDAIPKLRRGRVGSNGDGEVENARELADAPLSKPFLGSIGCGILCTFIQVRCALCDVPTVVMGR
jgi:hypothetical protein